MAEEFEFRDMSESVFWGVDLQRTTFRDVDLSGARISHARLVDVAIDGLVDRLIVNGVDVTAHVHQHDPWYPLRSQLHPTEAAHMAAGWQAFRAAWDETIDAARALPDEQRHASVDGEWSFVQTLRHLVFATDKWFVAPILDGSFDAIGLPNSGSADEPWPGVDRAASPSFDEAVATWHDRAAALADYLEQVAPETLALEVTVLENGPTEVHDCIGVVFEEHFEHLRYARRDLDRLG